MLDDDARHELTAKVKEQTKLSAQRLTEMRAEVRPLGSDTKTLASGSGGMAVAIMASDGGGNAFQFDPFMIQAVRVATSTEGNRAKYLDVISSETKPDDLLEKQFDANGQPLTALARMMKLLGVAHLSELCSGIPEEPDPKKPTSAWASFYRELVEWAVLLELAEIRWGNDVVLIFDGLLRTKKFNKGLFRHYLDHLKEVLARRQREDGCTVSIVGFCRTNQVLNRYRLALAAEKILTEPKAAYVRVPRDLEDKTYTWPEWWRGDDVEREPGEEVNNMVGGVLYFAKLGDQPYDPVWAIDVLQIQEGSVQTVMEHLLHDAERGFPITCYPRALQTAAENAAILDLDRSLFEDEVFDGMREALGENGDVLDVFQLQGSNPLG